MIFVIIAMRAYYPPYSSRKFNPILKISKLQAPTSKYNPIYSSKYGDFRGYASKHFHLNSNGNLVFYMCGKHQRSELRFKYQWIVNTKKENALKAQIKILPLNSKEFTFIQIHSTKTINKPLLRIAFCKKLRKKINHIWAIIRLSPTKHSKYIKIDLGRTPKDFFTIKVTVKNSKLTIYLNHKKFYIYVSSWKNIENYFKAGVYLQSDGCAKAIFKMLKVKYINKHNKSFD
ncbi:polysaccharide lyase family 7 protein [Hippea jasoniae]|uniref:polysaccharide lyase family 7 protein n=1 Tax=Hippea jasoniae TaxID=944479 RepID=UPI0006923957|nr:polysaccharide lyase family 7 protein [Hippea jasoniae]